MSKQTFRLSQGGLIDRGRAINFTFNGRSLQGYRGDTLASALIANDVKLVGRSFKYHRPRGIFSAGPEEPNALVHLGSNASGEANTRATQVILHEGLQVRSQNHWPSLGFDLLSVNNLLSPILSTGFYNKTFKWPRRFWPGYESVLRHIAGLGRAASEPGPECYEQCYRHCEVLIIGAGPAGLNAARSLVNSGLRVIVVDESSQPGGWLLRERATIDGARGIDWCQRIAGELDASDNVELLTQSTAFGYYDHNLLAVVEHLPERAGQRLHRVRAKQVILATGSIERPLVFANNDLPGIMLAGAARCYLNQFAAIVGKRAVIYTSNNSAYRTAVDLHDAGIEVAALADLRVTPGSNAMASMRERGIAVYAGAQLAAHGHGVLRSVTLRHSASKQAVKLDCDVLCMSGGWTPTLHLHSQSGGSSRFDSELEVFVPDTAKQQTVAAGAVNGLHSLQDCLADGQRAAVLAAERCQLRIEPPMAASDAELFADRSGDAAPAIDLFGAQGLGRDAKAKFFVDFQNDVTTRDVQQACQESYRSVEHLKRYTTLGMGTDQGKTSNLIGLSLLAAMRDEPIPEVGMTSFRPPYTPVILAALAGPQHGSSLSPRRRSPLHAQHHAAGAIFDFNGLWLRPRCYLRAGETEDAAIEREIRAVREGLGMTDVSTLGKFEIQGVDCVEFLNRVYVNNLSTLAPGRARYALMLREDGMVLDDGTVTCLGEQHYFITTSTGHAEHVLQHLEYLLDVAWPELDVSLVAVTEQWAGIALAGPRSRELLKLLVAPSAKLDSVSYMGYLSAPLQGMDNEVEARIIRISFSGELAYEIYVPARCASQLWELLTAHGDSFGLQPYGMDAMDVLRIEKGFIVVGAETDGRSTATDIGMGAMVSKHKTFIGSHALTRPALQEPDRLQLVGLQAVNAGTLLREGAQLTNRTEDHGYGASIGHISSAGFSPQFRRSVALARVKGGRDRVGDIIYCSDPARGNKQSVAVEIIEPCIYDRDGSRLKV